MAPSAALVATVRKELRRLGVGATPDIVDRVPMHASLLQLSDDERLQIAVGLGSAPFDDRRTQTRAGHLLGHVATDLER